MAGFGTTLYFSNKASAVPPAVSSHTPQTKLTIGLDFMLATATATTTITATMTTGSNINSASTNIENTRSETRFNDSQCLFCNHVTSNLNQNLEHMSKAHGLHIDLTELLVDVESLLSFMHLLIFECHECIYCGTQRNTRQAVQQHMVAKGHCKYDLEDEESELYDFFGQSSSVLGEKRRQLLVERYSNDINLSSKSKSRSGSQKWQSVGSLEDPAANENSPILQSEDPQPDSSSDSDTSTRIPSLALSTRVLKQEHTLQTQLSRLRAADRQNLAHLPASQQRAILGTRLKQMEQGRRAEQTYRGHLESSGNKFGRLDRIRLTRMPPHTGNVNSLNR